MSAESRPRVEVSRDIEAAAEPALRNMKDIRLRKPAEIAKPFENQFSYVLPEQAAVASMFPHAEPVNNKTVKVVAPHFIDAYLAFRALAAFTGSAEELSFMCPGRIGRRGKAFANTQYEAVLRCKPPAMRFRHS